MKNQSGETNIEASSECKAQSREKPETIQKQFVHVY